MGSPMDTPPLSLESNLVSSVVSFVLLDMRFLFFLEIDTKRKKRLQELATCLASE